MAMIASSMPPPRWTAIAPSSASSANVQIRRPPPRPLAFAAFSFDADQNAEHERNAEVKPDPVAHSTSLTETLADLNSPRFLYSQRPDRLGATLGVPA